MSFSKGSKGYLMIEKHVTSVGHMFIYHSMYHCFEDFICFFEFLIGIWVVGGCELMSKAQFVGEFNEKFILEMFSMVGH